VTARRRRLAQSGQAVVEFALVLPLLLILMTGILQFGLMLNHYITLTDAVRSGARYLSLGRTYPDPCDGAINATVSAATNVGLTSSQVGTTLSGTDSCGTGSYPSRSNPSLTEGSPATVTASQPFTLTVFGLPLFSVNLSATATDAIE